MSNEIVKKPIDSTGAPADWAFPIASEKMVYLTFSSQPTNEDIGVLIKYLEITKAVMPLHKQGEE